MKVICHKGPRPEDPSIFPFKAIVRKSGAPEKLRINDGRKSEGTFLNSNFIRIPKIVSEFLYLEPFSQYWSFSEIRWFLKKSKDSK